MIHINLNFNFRNIISRFQDFFITSLEVGILESIIQGNSFYNESNLIINYYIRNHYSKPVDIYISERIGYKDKGKWKTISEKNPCLRKRIIKLMTEPPRVFKLLRKPPHNKMIFLLLTGYVFRDRSETEKLSIEIKIDILNKSDSLRRVKIS